MNIITKCLFSVIFIFSNFSCKETPEDILIRAKAAAKEKNITKYLGCFTEKSKKLIENLLKVKEDTRGILKIIKNPFDLLPEGKIVKTKVDEHNNVAVINVKDRGITEKITMNKEKDNWKIDITLLDKFYKNFIEH